jgi:hypothetical protein
MRAGDLQIGMVIGFLTAWQVTAWLIRRGWRPWSGGDVTGLTAPGAVPPRRVRRGA